MNARSLAALSLRHSRWLLVAALALALTACAANPFQKASSTHACADKVAQAITSGRSVSGSWNCLSPDFQNTLHAYGMDGDGAFADSSLPPMTTTYIGQHGDVVVYHLVIASSGNHAAESLVLIIYVDKNGLVTNAGVGHAAF